MPLQAGTRLGPYEIVAPLGSGGMGVVYRARDSRLRRDVAIKLLPEMAASSPDARARLVREARIAASLNHPHVCTVHDVADTDGVAFIAMELVEGETLRAAIARGRFSPQRVCRIGVQLAKGLACAHDHGVIHRDFKTANVVLMPNEHAKIMDFGIAVRGGAASDHTATVSAGDAVPGVSGTIGYMAPEVLQGAAPGIRSDIWSLGVVLYEMASGRLPFDQRAGSELIAAILRDHPPPLPAGTPAGLGRVIERCLAKEAVNRPASAGEVALGLEVASPAAPILSDEPTFARGRTPGIWIAGLVALLVSGLTASYYMRNSADDGGNAPAIFATPTKVTTDVGVEEFAAWSPDGAMLAYAADPTGGPFSGTWDILVSQPRGGAPINRTSDYAGRDLFPSWSPDGTQIAFWSERDGGGCYVMPSLAGGARRVAKASLNDPSPPVWSSDGTRIGCLEGENFAVGLQFVSLQTGQLTNRIPLPGEPRKSFVTMTQDDRLLAFVDSTASISSDVKRLWIVDARAGTSTPLTDGQTNVVSPAWSPDGRILYYVASSGAAMDLWAQRVTAGGLPDGQPRPVTTGVGIRSAALSTDGRKLAYSQGRKVANVWRVPLRTGAPATWADAVQLTFDQAFIECFDLNRAGTRLVISSDRSGSLDLWTLPSGGGDLHQLTSDASAEWCPNWSPDGATVAFYAYRTGNREVWTMPATGGEWRQITNNAGVDMLPGWSSDGKELLFLSDRNGWVGSFAQPLDGGPGRQLMANDSLRWSPVDRRVAYTDDVMVMIADDDGAGRPAQLASIAAIDRPAVGAGGRISWLPDGSGVLFPARDSVTILGVDANGKSPARPLVSLAGRRGALGAYGTPTDGKFIYFTWHEDVGDLWVMTAHDAK